MGFFSETLRVCEAGTVTTILSKHLTCIHHVYVHEHACTPEDQFIFELLLTRRFPQTLAETTQGRIDSPKKTGRNDPPTRAETTHPQNWPKRPRPKRLRPKRLRAETTRILFEGVFTIALTGLFDPEYYIHQGRS